MALNPDYILLQGLEQYFVNKDTGLPLANGLVYFYEDDNRNNPKSVYELSGAPPNYSYSALPNPITLSMTGTIVDNSGNDVAVYYYPYDQNGNPQLYYIVVTDSAGNMQFTRQAWPNEPIGNNNPNNAAEGFPANMIANPQFAFVSFNPSTGIVFTIAGSGTSTFPIAPGWNLVVSTTGASSVTVNQIAFQVIRVILRTHPIR